MGAPWFGPERPGYDSPGQSAAAPWVTSPHKSSSPERAKQRFIREVCPGHDNSPGFRPLGWVRGVRMVGVVAGVEMRQRLVESTSPGNNVEGLPPLLVFTNDPGIHAFLVLRLQEFQRKPAIDHLPDGHCLKNRALAAVVPPDQQVEVRELVLIALKNLDLL